MANYQLKFRRAVDQDAESLSQLICENAKTMLLPHYYDKQWDIFMKYYSPEVMRLKIKEQFIFCAELDGNIIGTIALDKHLVAGFYTRLAYLNQGIGNSLMQHLEEFASGKGLDEIQLNASPEGMSFYYKHGWEKVMDITVEHYGVGFKEILMVKRLKKQ